MAIAPVDRGGEFTGRAEPICVGECEHGPAEGGAFDDVQGLWVRRKDGVQDRGGRRGHGCRATCIGDRNRKVGRAFLRVGIRPRYIEATRAIARDGPGRGMAVAPVDTRCVVGGGGSRISVAERGDHAAEGNSLSCIEDLRGCRQSRIDHVGRCLHAGARTADVGYAHADLVVAFFGIGVVAADGEAARTVRRDRAR